MSVCVSPFAHHRTMTVTEEHKGISDEMAFEIMRDTVIAMRQGKDATLLDVAESSIADSPLGGVYTRLLAPQVVLWLLTIYTIAFGGTAFSYAYTFLSYGLVALCCSISPTTMMPALKSSHVAIVGAEELQRIVWGTFRLRTLVNFVVLGTVAWALQLSAVAQTLLAVSPGLLFVADALNRPRFWTCVNHMYFGLRMRQQ